MPLVLRVCALGGRSHLRLLMLLVSWLRLRMFWRVLLRLVDGLGRLKEGYLTGEDSVDVGTDGGRFELVHVAGTGED